MNPREIGRRPLIDRLKEKYTVNTKTGCWVWTGMLSEDGYGKLAYQNKHRLAHRLSWIAHNGPIPDGAHVLHNCDTPPCINPDHLRLGSHQDNMRDRAIRGRTKHQVYHGEKNPAAVLTTAEVLAIRASREKQHVLASKYEISQSAISNIKSRKRWGHIP